MKKSENSLLLSRKRNNVFMDSIYLKRGNIMNKKVKIILTIVSLSLIIVINGCSNKMKTAPWSEKDIQKMEQEYQTTVPILRMEF